MYFPVIETLKKLAVEFFVFYGTTLCFHTKHNKEMFMKMLDEKDWHPSIIGEFKKCPTKVDKLDYIGGHIINLLLPAGIWFLNIVIWSNKYG